MTFLKLARSLKARFTAAKSARAGDEPQNFDVSFCPFCFVGVGKADFWPFYAVLPVFARFPAGLEIILMRFSLPFDMGDFVVDMFRKLRICAARLWQPLPFAFTLIQNSKLDIKKKLHLEWRQ